MNRFANEDSRTNREGEGKYENGTDEAKAAVPALIECLKKDPAPEVRREAARALGKTGVETKEVIAALSEGLKDKSLDVQCQSILAIGKIGIQTQHVEVQRACALALVGIGPEAKAAVPDLAKGLTDVEMDVQRACAEAAALRLSPNETGAKIVRDIFQKYRDKGK
jgi:HEAT repeat protein